MEPSPVPTSTTFASCGLTARAKIGLARRSAGAASATQVLSAGPAAETGRAGSATSTVAAKRARVAGRRWENGDTDGGIIADRRLFDHRSRSLEAGLLRESKHPGLESGCAGENRSARPCPFHAGYVAGQRDPERRPGAADRGWA